MTECETTQAQVTWTKGLQFIGHGSLSNAAIVLDGAPESGGTGTGLRPTEALLVSLAGCTAMDVISILQKKRQKVTGLCVNVQSVRSEEHPKRFTRIELQFIVRGYDVAPEAVARSIELSQTKYCTVTSSLNAEVVATYRIEQEEA
jgi:putative redox protein